MNFFGSSAWNRARQARGSLERLRLLSTLLLEEIVCLARSGFGLSVPPGMEEISVQQAKIFGLPRMRSQFVELTRFFL